MVFIAFFLTHATLSGDREYLRLKADDLEVSVKRIPAEGAADLTAKVNGRTIYHFYQESVGIKDLKTWTPHNEVSGDPIRGFSFELEFSTGRGTELMVVAPPKTGTQWKSVLDLELPLGRFHAPEWVDLDNDGILELVAVTAWKNYPATHGGKTFSDEASVYKWIPSDHKFRCVAYRKYADRLKPLRPVKTTIP